MAVDVEGPVAIIGGTGRLGPGIARHLARAGVAVIIGSREASRASDAGKALHEAGIPEELVREATNLEAARECAIAIVTIPAGAVQSTMPELSEALAGKVVVSTVVPMSFAGDGPRYDAPAQGSAMEEIAALVPAARVTGALHTVSSRALGRDDPIDEDVLIVGDDDGALAVTEAIVRTIPGARPVVAGGGGVARACEQLTVLLLGINRRHKATTGIRITHLK